MGKKNKRTAAASTPSSSPVSQKRTKTEPSSSQLPSELEPSSSQQLPTLKYEDMPLNHKRKFYIDDDCGSLKKYIELITWLRTMSTFDGSVFDGISNLHYSGQTYPLVEVEVITPLGNSAKFIIYKMTLYVIAFLTHIGWFQFECEFNITSFRKLVGFQGSYTTQPWKNVGPNCMINAVDVLATHELDLSDAGVMKHFVRACEIFHVHLSEAARLYPIESLICKSLVSNSKAEKFDKRTYEDEELRILENEKGQVVESNNDIYLQVKADGPVNSALSIATPNYFEDLLKKYSNLSKVWYVYSLSGRKWFGMAPHDVSRFHMRSVKSLRCTLGVLCNINLEKVLMEWNKKCSNHATITPEVYKEMEKRVHQLQKQNKVLVQK